MATIYRVDGTVLQVQPAKGRKFTLSEVQAILGGYVEAVPLPKVKGQKAQTVLCDEEGQIKGLPWNLNFHKLVQPWALAGDVMVVQRGEF